MALRDADKIRIVDSPHAFDTTWGDIKSEMLASPTLTGSPNIGTPTSGDVSGINGGLGCIEVAFTVAEMTDGGGTSGTLDVETSVPVGARLLNCSLNVTGAFLGDVSAVVIVGDGTDHDRFNTGTPSVFTTGHVDMGAVSGTAFVSAQITPRITITSATDFGLVVTNGTGAGVLRLNYLQPAGDGGGDEG